jgi:hypothetical protein
LALLTKKGVSWPSNPESVTARVPLYVMIPPREGGAGP